MSRSSRASLASGLACRRLSWWPPGHSIGWEHTIIHQLAHLLDAIAHDRDVAPYGATFEVDYKAAVICDASLASAESERRVNIGY